MYSYIGSKIRQTRKKILVLQEKEKIIIKERDKYKKANTEYMRKLRLIKKEAKK